MSIDEAIKHARKVAEDKRADADWKWRHGRLNSDDCISCAECHEQLADWLEELKALKEENSELHNEAQAERAFLTERDAEIRAKAIDEFAERLLEKAPKNYAGGLELGGMSCYLSANQVKEIAEQLKGGAVDEQID